MPPDKSLENQQPPATLTEIQSRETAPPTASLFSGGTEYAGTKFDGSDKTERTNSGQLNYGVRSRAYSLPPRPEVEEAFADGLAEEVLP